MKKLVLSLTTILIFGFFVSISHAMIPFYEFTAVNEVEKTASVKLSTHYGYEASLEALTKEDGLDVIRSEKDAMSAEVKFTSDEALDNAKAFLDPDKPSIRITSMPAVDEELKSEEPINTDQSLPYETGLAPGIGSNTENVSNATSTTDLSVTFGVGLLLGIVLTLVFKSSRKN